ncbi:MAG: hypothetical protein V3T86_10235 [Planctomycetota bacterium]
MRRLSNVAAVCIALIGGIAFAALLTVDKAQKIVDDYQAEKHRLAGAFQALDVQFPVPVGEALQADRIEAFLVVRIAVADLLDARGGVESGAISILKTRMELLDTLLEELKTAKMSRTEYKNITYRLWALFARGSEPNADGPMSQLNLAWRAALKKGRARDRITLPGPAASIADFERDLIYSNGEALEDSMAGDWVMSLLKDLD